MAIYLKGQLGEWAPRQPQWQHWGELWLTVAVVVEDWLVDATAAEVAATAVEECIVEKGLVESRFSWLSCCWNALDELGDEGSGEENVGPFMEFAR